MAVLARSGDSFTLPDRCIVGRSRACDLVVTGSDVSGQHAVLQWNGQHWQLQDLGSRNGTYLDDAPVVPGKRVIVPLGARLRFGHEETWRFVDAGAPQLMAVRVDTGEVRVAEGGLLALPDSQDPIVSIYPDAAGAWLCERRGEPTILGDREILPIGAVAWKIYLPTACEGTAEDGASVPCVAGLRLRLAFSRDEEIIEAMAFAGERRLDLQVRAHNYLLLLLTRRRLADREAGVQDADQGWIRQDDLLRMLRIDEAHLNITIHRARAQLGRVGVADAAALIERRPGVRQLRIGVRDLELASLDEPRAR